MGALIARPAKPHGAERSGAVAPHSETTGHPTAAAMCIGPQSGPKAARQERKIPRRSSFAKLVFPHSAAVVFPPHFCVTYLSSPLNPSLKLTFLQSLTPSLP